MARYNSTGEKPISLVFLLTHRIADAPEVSPHGSSDKVLTFSGNLGTPSKGVGSWPVGKIATITIELESQEMVFLNVGPAHQLNSAFSFFTAFVSVPSSGLP
jgi:hypothetical protein